MTANSSRPGLPAELSQLTARAEREHRAGRLPEAIAAYQKLLTLVPDHAEAYNALGGALAAQGQLELAAAHVERAVALRPDLAEAYYHLGNILFRQGRLDAAAWRYRQAIELRPDFAEAQNGLGALLRSRGQLAEALAACQRAVEIQPTMFEAHRNVGRILWDLGKTDLCAEHCRRAVAMFPDSAEAWFSLGVVLKELGEFDEAAAGLTRALALQPDLTEVYLNRGELKTYRPGDADLAELERLAADPPRFAPAKMLPVHFALGKALEDIGDYPRAFEQWLRGNAIQRHEMPYDEEDSRQTFRRLIDQFGPRLLDPVGQVGDPSPAPIFIIGMPRSGSTLIEQILASHPLVHAAGELSQLGRAVYAVLGGPGDYAAALAGCDAARLRGLGESYLASVPLPAGKTRLTDKMPSNFFYVGLIRLILPNARIIHSVRDPVDICLACFAKLFASGHQFTYDLGTMGRYYRWYYELMEHWRSLLPADAMLEVSYEQVVDDLEAQARRLLDYCGLPWDDRCLRFHEMRRPIRTASSVQVRRPLYRSSLARWRRYEAFLEPLLAELAPCRRAD